MSASSGAEALPAAALAAKRADRQADRSRRSEDCKDGERYRSKSVIARSQWMINASFEPRPGAGVDSSGPAGARTTPGL